MALPSPDKNNIINLLPNHLSTGNEKTIKQFRLFSPTYDPLMKYLIRPLIHRANAKRHGNIWKEMLGSVQKNRILDLACGTGGLIPYTNTNNSYTGLDLSYEMLKRAEIRARKKGFLTYRMVLASAEEQVFPPDSFEVIMTDTALHMIPDWQGAIDAAAQAIVDNGLFMGAVPIQGIDDRFDRIWKKQSSHPQFHALTRKDLQKACNENQLDFTDIAVNGGMFYFQARKKIRTK